MFRNALRLPFTLLGIPLYLDLSFLIILPLFAWIIGSQVGAFVMLLGMPVAAEQLTGGAVPYLLGIVAALLLFVSVVIHELGHAVTARRYGVETERITLWFLGGMAQFPDMPRQRGAEAVVAIAGPITSLALAVLGWLLLQVVPVEWAAVYFVVAYITAMNVALAVFNMIPALPLDGGRVLRSLLAMRMSRVRATNIAGAVSRVLAVVLGIFGFLSLNFFLMLIAFFIYIAVNAETRHTVMGQIFEGIPVERVMTRQVVWVPPTMTVDDLIDKMFREARLAYPVVEQGVAVGMVTLGDVQNVAPETTVGAAMNRGVQTIARHASANEAFDVMARNNYGRLLVVDERGQIVGIVTSTDLMRALEVGMVGARFNHEAAKGHA